MSSHQEELNKYFNKDKKLAVIGLGYVGLPIALELARKFSVIGFDISASRVEMMRNKIDPSKELDSSAFDGADIFFTHQLEDLKQAQFFIVAVPTPVDEHKTPDLLPLQKASETLSKVIKKGDYVVYESTVYPGCTEEDCVPVIEKGSGLKAYVDFKVGYSPERINPGDTLHTLTKVKKVVSGCDEESLEVIAGIYGAIIEPGVFKAASIKVAEAAKVIENTQRDLNIALMNELSQVFNIMDINTYDVLEAAGTKWNFLNFQPGLVGGHCIGVDPYYLTYKAMKLGYRPQIILSGRGINDGMAAYVAKKVAQHLIAQGKNPKDSKVLIMGATFKEDVSDIRNSKIFDLYQELKDFSVQIDMVDPYASKEEVAHEYGVQLSDNPGNQYDAVVVAVPHKEYKSLNEDYFKEILVSDALIVDLKNIFKNKITTFTHWTL
ncbi:MAG: nucleotide sugar dehydrogenase [Chitinophagales bacterium]|nr:nucleotide sugar dehydrogenase [Chitinophagales bacterium]